MQCHVDAALVVDVAVGEETALGLARGARRVEHDGRVVGLDAHPLEGRPLGAAAHILHLSPRSAARRHARSQHHHVPEGGQPRARDRTVGRIDAEADLAEDLEIVDAGCVEPIGEDEDLGVGLAQHVLDFEGLVAAVAGDGDPAHLGDGEMRHVPLDAIGHPEHGMIAGGEAESHETEGEGVHAALELAVGDALLAEDHGLAGGIAGRRIVEELPQGESGPQRLRHCLTASICSSICRARLKAWASSSCDTP
jgi:hypothetical protein